MMSTVIGWEESVMGLRRETPAQSEGVKEGLLEEVTPELSVKE